MVPAATHPNGILFKCPQAWCGLASIEDRCRSPRHRFHKLPRQSGNTGEPLEKIQCDTLARKQPCGRPRDVSKDATLVDCIAVAIGTLDDNLFRDMVKCPADD